MKETMPDNSRFFEGGSPSQFSKKEAKGKRLVAQITDAISELEKKIDAPETEKTIREWLVCQSKFHSYSMMNTFWMQIQSAFKNIPLSQVASFLKWTEMKNDKGEQVQIKKGAKSFSIIFPMFKTIFQKDENGNYLLDANGDKIPQKNADGTDKRLIFYGVGHVFDISQTNAVEIGAVKTLDHRGMDVPVQPGILDEVADRITKNYGFPVHFVSDPSNAAGGWFDRTDRSITINRAVSQTLSHQLGTLFHELGHGILHGDKSCNFSRELKEGQAEAFAYAAASAFGIERKSELYIKSWIENDVPLADVLNGISENVRTAFEKLNLEELAIKNSIQPDPLAPDRSPVAESEIARQSLWIPLYNCIGQYWGKLNDKQVRAAFSFLDKASSADLSELFVMYQASLRDNIPGKICAAQLVMEIDRKIKAADKKLSADDQQMTFNF